MWKRAGAWALGTILLLGLAGSASAQQIVFVTRATVPGNVTVAGADAVCADEATQAGLANPAQFTAWLSTSTVNAIDRIPAGNGPYVLPDVGATVVANDTAQLLSASLIVPIDAFADGTSAAPPPDRTPVWTGTDSLGLASNNTCNDWMSSDGADLGERGNHGDRFSSWTEEFGDECSQTFRLYCFGPPPTAPEPVPPVPGISAWTTVAMVMMLGAALFAVHAGRSSTRGRNTATS